MKPIFSNLRAVEDHTPFLPNKDDFTAWHYLKDQYPEFIIILRAGDKYVTLAKDAETVSLVMGDNGESTQDIEFLILDQNLYYILSELTKAGHKIAICDPLNEPDAYLFT